MKRSIYAKNIEATKTDFVEMDREDLLFVKANSNFMFGRSQLSKFVDNPPLESRKVSIASDQDHIGVEHSMDLCSGLEREGNDGLDINIAQ